MGRSKSAAWIGGAAFLGVMILIAAWFLAISPRLESASEMREQAESEQVRIDQLEIQLAGLKADFENIDELRAELEEIKIQLPSDLQLPELTRQVHEAAEQADVFVVSMNPGVPMPIEPAVEEPPAAEPAAEDESTEDDDAESEADGDEGDPTTAQPSGSVVEGLYVLPLEITVLGGFDRTIDLLDRLQTMNPRLILASSVSATGQEERGAEGGKPEVEDGDAETVITAYAFVLRNMDGAPAGEEAPEPPSDAEPMPTPDDDDTSFGGAAQ